jgi:hypothetical protein
VRSGVGGGVGDLKFSHTRLSAESQCSLFFSSTQPTFFFPIKLSALLSGFQLNQPLKKVLEITSFRLKIFNSICNQPICTFSLQIELVFNLLFVIDLTAMKFPFLNQIPHSNFTLISIS